MIKFLKNLFHSDEQVVRIEIKKEEVREEVRVAPIVDDDCMCGSGHSGYCHKHHTTWI
jgi:hypothetical protein